MVNNCVKVVYAWNVYKQFLTFKRRKLRLKPKEDVLHFVRPLKANYTISEYTLLSKTIYKNKTLKIQ